MTGKSRPAKSVFNTTSTVLGKTLIVLLTAGAVLAVGVSLFPIAGGIAGVIFAVHSLWTCERVETEEQAFELSKQYILSKRMDELREKGGDASIFENSEIGNFYLTCNEPPRYHFARRDRDGFDVRWVWFIKESCDGCWKTVDVGVHVSNCGFTSRSSSVSHPFKATTDPALRSRGLDCPPRYWPPSPIQRDDVKQDEAPR